MRTNRQDKLQGGNKSGIQNISTRTIHFWDRCRIPFSHNNKWPVTNEDWTTLINDQHEICDNVLEMMEIYSENCETKGNFQ